LKSLRLNTVVSPFFSSSFGHTPVFANNIYKRAHFQRRLHFPYAGDNVFNPAAWGKRCQ
jgi:hypothetical protein